MRPVGGVMARWSQGAMYATQRQARWQVLEQGPWRHGTAHRPATPLRLLPRGLQWNLFSNATQPFDTTPQRALSKRCEGHGCAHA